jgi:hypothetical protein
VYLRALWQVAQDLLELYLVALVNRSGLGKPISAPDPFHEAASIPIELGKSSTETSVTVKGVTMFERAMSRRS